jgi:hypothetical protein
MTEETAQKILDAGAVYLSNEHGGFLLVPGNENVYEVHTQFRPEGRGSALNNFAAHCIRKVFSQTPCIALRTFVPDGNVAAFSFARRMGFVQIADGIAHGRRGRTLLLTLKQWVMDQCQPQP